MKKEYKVKKLNPNKYVCYFNLKKSTLYCHVLYKVFLLYSTNLTTIS